MDESSLKANREHSSAQTLANFIKNPLDKTVKPRHIVGFAIDKRRAKSLLKKVDRAHTIENEKILSKAKIDVILGFDEIIAEMKVRGYIDKKLQKLLRENVYDNPITAQQREDLWYFASGAKLKKDMNPGYYAKLAHGFKNYPEYFSQMIEKDLRRTFPEKIYDPKDPIIQKMRSVLNSYAKRNPIIGYCQGLNFIVARIIEVIEDEEKSFWIFCSLIEDLLPIDYFSSMVGVLVDQKIFSEMVNHYDKTLAAKFSDLEVDPSLFSLQWFVCCFVSTLSANLCNAIWDLLFIEGSCALYKAGLVFLSSLKPQILEVREFNEIFSIIEDSSQFLEEPRDLIKKMQQIYVSKRLVNILRRQYQWMVEEELHALESKKKNRNQLIHTRDLLTCREDWPVCIDVLENSKQKKRNTSAFSLRVDKVQGSKTNYFSQDFKHTHYHNSRVAGNVSKKKAAIKERGRDKFKTFNAPLEETEFLRNMLEKGPENVQKLMKADTLKDKRGAIRDSDEESEDTNDFTKYSEDPRSVQKQLVMGRQNHSCQESLRLKKLNYKKPVSPSQRNKKAEIMAQYVKSSLDGLRDSKSPTPQRNVNRFPVKIKSEVKIPAVQNRTFTAIGPDKQTEPKGSVIGSFLRGLFGNNYLKRQESEVNPAVDNRERKINIISPGVSSSTEEIPKRGGILRDYDEYEEESKGNHRKMTIYNYIVDTNPDTAADSAKKSVLFMREFFKE